MNHRTLAQPSGGSKWARCGNVEHRAAIRVSRVTVIEFLGGGHDEIAG
jgi:hypothetical protein